jgi:pimeloyl-ACP methyl ester carboxylesterase
MEVSLPGAGHWVQQERPQAVNAALVAFLDGVKDRL